MFGGMNPAAMMAALRQGKNAQGKMQRDEDMIQRRDDIIGEAPRQDPRWVQVAGAIGAGLQDIGHSRGSGHLDRFAQAQEQMRQARQQHDQRRRRFEQLSRNISPSDQQFWNAFALGGEEAAMQVLNSRSERKYDSQVRNDDRAFRQDMAQADRDFRRSEGQADRDLRRSEGAADREAAAINRMNTAIVSEARMAEGLGPNDPLTPRAREIIAQRIVAETQGKPGEAATAMMLAGYSQEEIERYLRGRLTGAGNDEIEAVAGVLSSQ